MAITTVLFPRCPFPGRLKGHGRLVCGALDLSDAAAALGFLFLGNPEQLPCGDGSDKDSANLKLIDWQPDGTMDISDAVAMLSFLFIGGPPHPLAVPEAELTGCVRIAGCPDTCGG